MASQVTTRRRGTEIMDGWPDDWFRNDAANSPGGGGDRGRAGRADRRLTSEPTEDLKQRMPAGPGGQAGASAAAASARPTQGPPGGASWPAQPPAYGPGAGQAGGAVGGRRHGRRTLKIFAALVALLLVGTAGMYFYLDGRLNKVAVLADYSGRPAASAGQNWLITGSDSRQGLTRQQENQFATGHNISGQRSDTIMLLHIPGSGGPATLVSLPRDSYVPIPGYGQNKLNAAFAFGGPALLAQTVQEVTGLRIDHYMGIGFGGLVNVVDAVGGVTICIKHTLRDTASGLNLAPGCHTLTGGQALGYVRDRHSFAASDLQRVKDQRVFLKALLQKTTSPSVFLNPFAAIPTATNSASALTVDEGTHLYQLIRVAFALRGSQTTTVPIASDEPTAVGDALVWDHAKALRLFNALGADQPVPKDLLTGSAGG